MADEITITIDGKEVKTTSDKMVVQAANDVGIYIPYLCYHPGMKPYGACRMCVVDVEGPRGTATLAACTLPVADGMVVHTTAEKPQAVRDTTLDLLLSEHPHGCLTCHRIDLCGPDDICLRHVDVTDRCVTCPKNERCELKDTTRYHTQGLASPLNFVYRDLQVETKDPFYDRDYNLCIVCARCVRACDELRGDVALTLTERAGQTLVGTVMGESLLEAGCEFCGACLDVCPVGALTETQYKWERPARTEQSICAECPVGCTMTYEVNRWEKVVRVIPELNAPANHGQACFRGKFGFDYVNDKRRLTQPMVRRDGQLQDATWEEALRAAAGGLEAHKGEGSALVASPRNTNEELYVAQKFARMAMGTHSVNIASNDRPGVMEGLGDILGYYAGTMSLDDLRGASVVLAINANITEEQNVAAVAIKQAVRAGTQKLVVIDHREVELTRYASLWLRPYPGTDAALLGGLLRVVIDSGLADDTFLAERAENLEALAVSLEPFTPEAVAETTGVTVEQIELAAYQLATGGPAAIVYAFDGTQHGTRRPASRAVANLALATGNVGKPNAGIMPLQYGANSQGAWDVGAWSGVLPGHELAEEPNAQARIASLWGAPLPMAPGLGLNETFDAAREGRIKAMVMLGDHVHYEDGTLGDVGAALDRLEFLVIADAFRSSAVEKADVVFPTTVWAEKTGTFTNMERRVQLLRPVVANKHADVHADLDVLVGIALAMGVPGLAFDSPASAFEEITKAVPVYAGISHERLAAETVSVPKPSNDEPLPTQVLYSNDVQQGIQWPSPSKDDKPSPFLYEKSFRHGKARLGAIAWSERPVTSTVAQPFLLAHGRVLIQAGRDAEVTSDGNRNRVGRTEEFLLNTADAQKLGVEDGQPVMATSADGWSLTGTARVTDDVLPGVASLTTLFGEMATDIESTEGPDAMNHVPRLRTVGVRIETA